MLNSYLQGVEYNVADSGNKRPPDFKNLSLAAITESNIPSCRR